MHIVGCYKLPILIIQRESEICLPNILNTKLRHQTKSYTFKTLQLLNCVCVCVWYIMYINIYYLSTILVNIHEFSSKQRQIWYSDISIT
jgi:hypothetical protein